ncbi:hypothetical protein [Fodinicola acaciae]|uniref:hypothetical protein n=1 Tax=Fodinicola acaciae TaxID=2681555 RepID=UPI0013D6CCE4|nr:hypothetical protein [Fodinicola acaciae]
MSFRPEDYRPPDIAPAPPRRHWKIPGWLVALACVAALAVLAVAGVRLLLHSTPASNDRFQTFPTEPRKLVSADSLAIVIPDASEPYCDAVHDLVVQKWRLCIWQSGTGTGIRQLTATVRFFPTSAQKVSGAAAALADLARLRTTLSDVTDIPKLGDRAFSGFDRTADKVVTAVAISNVTVQATYTERLSVAATADIAPAGWRSASDRVAREMVRRLR